MDATRAQQLHERRKAVANTIAEAHAHALLITDLRNVEYLTGFRGSNAAFLLRADGTGIVATDGRYATQIALQTGEPDDVEIMVESNIVRALNARFQEETEQTLRVEPGMSLGQARALGDPEIISNAVEQARLIKDDAEIQALRAAGQLADSVWQQFIAEGGIREGMTEIEAAADLENRLRKAGADSLSFDTILASGINGSKPHAGVSKDVIVPGLVTVDFGVYLDGYASDQTRTVCVGEPTDRDFELYDTVYRSQKAGEAILRPGTGLREVDSACRQIIESAGYGEYFVHSTGHGVGLDVHEAPRAAQTVDEADKLQEGMTLTVEPGIYLPGDTGLRIENTYIITADGAESLNASATELIVV